MQNIKKYLDLLDKKTVFIESIKNKKEENELRITKITNSLLGFSEFKTILTFFSGFIFSLFLLAWFFVSFFDTTDSIGHLVNVFGLFYFAFLFFGLLLYYNSILFVHKNGGQIKINQELEKIEKNNTEYKSKITDIDKELNETYDLIDKNDILKYLEQHKEIDDKVYTLINNRLSSILKIKKNNLKENVLFLKISEIEELEDFEKQSLLVTN